MDHDDYRYFEELSRTLHFARAARNLTMSASALTRRIQGMEDEVGQALLVRDHREVQLTEAGTRFATFCRAQLDAWEEFQTELQAAESHPSGDLAIACTVTACHTVLPSLVSDFRARYPEVTLRLFTQDAARSLIQLEEGEVDLAVIPTDDDLPASLDAVPLAFTDLAFIAPRNSPSISCDTSDPKLLAEVPFVLPSSGLEHQRLMEWLRKSRISPPIAAEVHGNEGLIAMVALGSGLALVPSLVLETSPLRSQVQKLPRLRPPVGYSVSLCTKKSSLARRLVSLFHETASQQLRGGSAGPLHDRPAP